MGCEDDLSMATAASAESNLAGKAPIGQSNDAGAIPTSDGQSMMWTDGRMGFKVLHILALEFFRFFFKCHQRWFEPFKKKSIKRKILFVIFWF